MEPEVTCGLRSASAPRNRTVTDSPEEKSRAHTGLPGQRRVPRPPRGLPGLHARGTAQRLQRRAREFPSKAAVIRSLWADIIAEDPGFYGTPDGMASLEADTEFLPCTSGMPGE